MSNSLLHNIQLIQQTPAILQSLTKLQRGLEKESLRITPEGKLALTGHPYHLGSALCHPKITTDYSESLLEFITPVHQTTTGVLQSLYNTHHFTYHTLAAQDELLWTGSMPCQLVKEKDIPVAEYGSSNVAKMKSVYRLGLGLRYGRMMQTISGIHYNFSLPDEFWANYQRKLGDSQSIHDFKTEKYFGMIRNFRRYAPLFVYLYGASPALCRSFLQGQNHNLASFDDHTWFNEYATSLRMSDLGYQSTAQEALSVCYNSLENYITTLKSGINNSFPDYEKQGTKDENGKPHQLNTSLLQIENEFYSIIRPKRVAASGEAPINALSRGGVEYIEIRCIDINPFHATGTDEHTLRFLDLLLLFCLFEDSPPADELSCQEASLNLKTVVNEGRKPGLSIQENGKAINFEQWCHTTLEKMRPLARMLDSLRANSSYNVSINKQQLKVQNPSLTPSAKVLDKMRRNNQTFAAFGREQSQHWQQHFLSEPLSDRVKSRFKDLAENSHAQQKTLEAAPQQSFDDYLKEFYEQYQ